MRHLILLIFIFALTACASSQEAVQLNADQINSLHNKTGALADRLQQVDTNLKQLNSKVDVLDKKLEDLGSDQLSTISTHIFDLDQRMSEMESGPATPPKGDVSIKVLSGTGNMSTALTLAQKMEGMGYEISRVDIAPLEFIHPTVFYANDFEVIADNIATEIGEDMITKPLTWDSIFNIIVVGMDAPAAE